MDGLSVDEIEVVVSVYVILSITFYLTKTLNFEVSLERVPDYRSGG
jgi:hypothetical protein